MASADDNLFFEWLSKHDPDIKTVFDVGAHVGQWSSRLSKYYPDAEFHLFEPRLAIDQELNEIHTQRTKHFKNHSIAKAVADTTGVLEFSVQGHEGVGSSLLVTRQSNVENTIVQVPTITLNDYARENGINNVDFLKMDIQGGELNALRGAGNILGRTKYLFLETWLISSYGQKTPHMFEVFDFLRSYNIFPLDFFGGYRTPHGNLAHIDVVFVNAELTKLPSHFYKATMRRIGC